MSETASSDETPQGATPYELIGGDAGVRRLTRRFYELMDALPEAAHCRAIHPESMAGAEQKLYEFLSGWLGGPPLFIERHGHPMLRRRHLPAPIGPKERDGWMLCFRRALVEQVEDEGLRGFILERVEALARHMQNRAFSPELPAGAPEADGGVAGGGVADGGSRHRHRGGA